MPEATTVLFGIEDEFDVASVDRTGPGQVQIIIEMRSREAPCPACGVLSGRVRERPLCRVKDLPASGQQTQLWWRKRRLLCREPLCPRRSFTQTSDAVRPRARSPNGSETRSRTRRQQPGGRRGGPGVRRVVADRAQGTDRGRARRSNSRSVMPIS